MKFIKGYLLEGIYRIVRLVGIEFSLFLILGKNLVKWLFFIFVFVSSNI